MAYSIEAQVLFFLGQPYRMLSLSTSERMFGGFTPHRDWSPRSEIIKDGADCSLSVCMLLLSSHALMVHGAYILERQITCQGTICLPSALIGLSE